MIELGIVFGILALILLTAVFIHSDNERMRRESEEYYRRYLKRRVDDDRTRVK